MTNFPVANLERKPLLAREAINATTDDASSALKHVLSSRHCEAEATLFSRLIFGWIWPHLQLAYANKKVPFLLTQSKTHHSLCSYSSKLLFDDLPPLMVQDNPAPLAAIFWTAYCANGRSFFRALHATFAWPFYLSAILCLGATVATLAVPLLLQVLLLFLVTNLMSEGPFKFAHPFQYSQHTGSSGDYFTNRRH